MLKHESVLHHRKDMMRSRRNVMLKHESVLHHRKDVMRSRRNVSWSRRNVMRSRRNVSWNAWALTWTHADAVVLD